MKHFSPWQTAVFALWAIASGIALFIPGPMKEVSFHGYNDRWFIHEVRDYVGLFVRQVAVTFVGLGSYAAVHVYKARKA